LVVSALRHGSQPSSARSSDLPGIHKCPTPSTSVDAWLRVRLPGRPNGHTGWIAAARTRPTSTPWRLVVSLSARRVIVFRSGRVVRRFTAIVGKPITWLARRIGAGVPVSIIAAA
jgi:hypothetical protein